MKVNSEGQEAFKHSEMFHAGSELQFILFLKRFFIKYLVITKKSEFEGFVYCTNQSQICQ